ncbi:Uncharacterised protein [Mycobacteroides abscessus subsp. massiliense]|uniref:Uncharacterized protein n=1 Tax=Mycobacteroides abscessus subsp. massiliense TaxID=1962118 RepID=A0A1U2CFX1_9MYCO|nr:Uncharacterised protein [Mycobacteroides abscessus subsp. massiliense]SKT32980.1 Uncharacterised protein [Mycobacteroides abscessus subsp. massiliense]SKT69823.1 Uncharacterised protein [Mycobacteroides abscessus subsp. massiliense]SKX08381.1 Uncharacterised protein [Mycobacteroides abscessus subsp. massiliense]
MQYSDLVRATSVQGYACADQIGRVGRVSPDQIQAVGGVIVSLLAAWQALTSRKIRDLETGLRAVEPHSHP